MYSLGTPGFYSLTNRDELFSLCNFLVRNKYNIEEHAHTWERAGACMFVPIEFLWIHHKFARNAHAISISILFQQTNKTKKPNNSKCEEMVPSLVSKTRQENFYY